MNFQKFLTAFIFLFAVYSSVFADVPAFPGAEGSGRFAMGGRGGDVYEVTNLNNSGLGSIVDAVSQENRTIVFRVSGTIELGDVILRPKSFTTIAGQTAPGDGICIKGRIQIYNVQDVIIRYLRVRVDKGAANADGDGIDIGGDYQVIVDHCSESYARDEGISSPYSYGVTVQWCIISESLTFQAHSYGSLVRGCFGYPVTYHHNLYAHNSGRNPRPGNEASNQDPYYDTDGLHFDFRNNVMYNWQGTTAGYNDDGPGYISRYNFIGNAYIPGPESTYNGKGFRERSKDCYGYFVDNSYDGIVPSDPWSIVNYPLTTGLDPYKSRSYLIPMEPVTTTSPAQAKIDVLAGAGASFPKRDIIDTRIVNDVINKTGHSIFDTDHQPEGGWPILNSATAPPDSDHDGMPDAWEISHGLNPNNADDRNGYNLSADYTNLEVYLDSLANTASPYVHRLRGYSGTADGSDNATDIAVDSAGNAYVTGYVKNSGTDYDFVTIKYTPDGTNAWTKIYNSGDASCDYAMAIAVDANNIIAAGYSNTVASGFDGAVVKYNSAGTQLWATPYNYSGTSDDRFYDVAADAGGYIYAVGRTDWNCLIVKYTPSGDIAWAKTYKGTGEGYNVLYKLAIDGSGNVYACGETAQTGTGQDCLVVKYSPDGILLWAQTYNSAADNWDMLKGIAIDSAGDIYVTGSAETATDSNYVTMKYSPDGIRSWTSFYSGTTSGWDESYAIAINSDGGVIVTGYSEGTTSGGDAVTVKYDPATGEQVWLKRYNGPGNSTDFTESIATDGTGRIYVHGRSEDANSTDYLTICYNASGTELWKKNYDGPAGLTDIGSAIVVYKDDIYVTGSSETSANNCDYATIKYTFTLPNLCPNPLAGDLDGDCQVGLLDLAILSENWLSRDISPNNIVSWGLNNYGQATPPEGNDFAAIAAGGNHSLGLKTDGSIAAWGRNHFGQCTVPSPNADFTAISAGFNFSLGLKANGSITAWGQNNFGQCTVPSPNADFMAISAGGVFSLGLKTNGSIAAWGYNYDNECDVPPPNANFVAISAGVLFSLGLKSDGSIAAWGQNDNGECDVPSPNTGFTAVAAGWYHSLGLKSDGSIVAWGWNNHGQCDVPSPNTGFVAIAAGEYHSLGLKSDGSIVAWGNNANGECTLPSPNISFTAISVGENFNLAMRFHPTGDLNGDYKVNFLDYVLLADNWIACGLSDPGNCWQ